MSPEAEDKYVGMLRKLVLQIASDVDCTIFLFGSRARGNSRRSSDIDVGFKDLDVSTFLSVRNRLLAELEESIIPHHVDIVHFDAADEKFRRAAEQGAIIWKRSSKGS